MKAIIEKTANSYHHVGSMTAVQDTLTLPLPSISQSSINQPFINQASLNQSPKVATIDTPPLNVGSSRQDCLAYLQQRNISSIHFAHWLAIPSLQLLLVFKGQRCVAVEHQLLAPLTS